VPIVSVEEDTYAAVMHYPKVKSSCFLLGTGLTWIILTIRITSKVQSLGVYYNG
jgi:hypothetical protein